MSHPYNPVTLYLKGFDWTGRTSRGQLLVCMVAVWIPATILLFLDLFGTASRLIEVGCWIALAALTVPMFGHVVRRLNDVDWPAFLACLLVVPIASFTLIIALLLKRRAYGRLYDVSPLRVAGFFLSIFVAALVLSRVIWSPYLVVAGSMKPNLLAGDVVIVERLGAVPAVGDVIAFEHPINGLAYLKRIVAAEGDTVQLLDGRLIINSAAVTLSQMEDWSELMGPQGPTRNYPRCANGAVGNGAVCTKIQYRETLPDSGGAGWPILDISQTGVMDNTGVWRVPPGHFFVLGDNRDNSLDSRVAAAAGGVGMVPQSAVIGRALRVLYSYDGPTAWRLWTWRTDRILRAIE